MQKSSSLKRAKNVQSSSQTPSSHLKKQQSQLKKKKSTKQPRLSTLSTPNRSLTTSTTTVPHNTVSPPQNLSFSPFLSSTRFFSTLSNTQTSPTTHTLSSLPSSPSSKSLLRNVLTTKHPKHSKNTIFRHFSTTTTPPSQSPPVSTAPPPLTPPSITTPPPTTPLAQNNISQDTITSPSRPSATVRARQQAAALRQANEARTRLAEKKKKKTTAFFSKRPEDYDSGDEVDDSEEEHNKKLLRLGKYGTRVNIPRDLFGEEETVLDKYLNLPKHNYKIQKIQRRTELLSKPSLTHEEEEILKECGEFNNNEITPDDILEYKLWNRVKKSALKKFSLRPNHFDFRQTVDNIEDIPIKLRHLYRQKTLKQQINQKKKGDSLNIADFWTVDQYYQEHPEFLQFPEIRGEIDSNGYAITNITDEINVVSDSDTGIDDDGVDNVVLDNDGKVINESSLNKQKKPRHPLYMGYNATSPITGAMGGISGQKEMSFEDNKKILQKLFGQPEGGNPELLYLPGIKPLWAEDQAPIDKNGNMLPINYDTHHLHDPYAYFRADTSIVFEPIKNPISDFDDHARKESYYALTMEEQVMNLRQSIKCPVELNAFDNTIVAMLTPRFYAQYIGQDNFSKPYSDRHWVYETLNHPDPEQRYIPVPHDFDSWDNFFFFDATTGPKKLKWFTIGMFGIAFGFAGLMSYEGVQAVHQYFYDLEHPLH